MIELVNFSFRYALGDRPALHDISLHIPAGQLCAIIGPNGAGKSTLCFALSGFIPYFYKGETTGAATVAGYNVLMTTPGALAGTVGLVFANPFNQITGARFTVREEAAYGLENLGVPRAEMEERVAAALALAGLSDLAERSPYTLSGGQQQRLAIASVIILRPRLLVLDEPTSQLDPLGTRDIFALLARLAAQDGTTVVLASHKLEWIGEHAGRVVVLDEGRIVADGSPAEVLVSAEIAAIAGQTRYTQAALQARAAGLTPPERPLPLTLSQAATYFGGGA